MFYVTHELVVQRREDHGIYEDLNSHLLTLTQLAEESTALTVCPFGQKVRRGGDYLSHSLTTMVGLLCPRRPYIELFCVEQKVKIIINNTWNIPFFTFTEQKTVN